MGPAGCKVSASLRRSPTSLSSTRLAGPIGGEPWPRCAPHRTRMDPRHCYRRLVRASIGQLQRRNHMTDKVAIISVDGHVKPPREAVREYIDPDFRDVLDESLRSAEGTPDGFVHPALGEVAQWDPARRLTD